MFNIDQTPTFSAEVEVLVPDAGGNRTETFSAVFRGLPVLEFEKVDMQDGASVTRFLNAAIVELGDITGADDAPIAYSEDLRDRVVDWPHARQALVRAYLEGYSRALEGN